MTRPARKPRQLPTALTVIKKIALAYGYLPGHENHMTKYQIINLARRWLSYRKTK